MKINDKLYLEKKEFVAKLSEALNFAKPHLTCEFKLGEELPLKKKWREIVINGEIVSEQIEYQPSGEFVVVTAKNGYKYTIDVTCNSLAAIGEEVFRAMMGK